MFNLDQWREQLTPFLAALKADGADEAEVIVNSKRLGATRFANNAISQNQDEDTTGLRLRVIRDGRQGVASGNSFAPEALQRIAEKALVAASKGEPDATLLPMIAEQPEYQSVHAYVEDAALATPKDRAERIGAQVAKAKAAGYESAGLLKTGATACAYINSNDVAAFYQHSIAGFNMSAFADGGATEAMQDASSLSLAELDCERVGSDVVERCGRARGAKEIPTGAYDVVLEEAALSDLMLFLGWLGFNSLAHAEGRSGLAGKIGEQVFSDKLTIRADPFDPRQAGCPFDMEGFPTQALELINAGTVTALPHDRRTAAKMGRANTGHGNSQPDGNGPTPSCLVVSSGDSSLAEMIANTERGLLITSFHYTNAVDPMALSITGMTRGGTWLIENGKVAHAVENMRFTQSLISAFQNVDAVSRQASFRSGGLFGGGMVLPAMKIKGFAFSSESGF